MILSVTLQSGTVKVRNNLGCAALGVAERQLFLALSEGVDIVGQR